MNHNLALSLGNLLTVLREKKPLVHHLTNYVTVNDCANVVLAIGASPIMADDIGEVETITAISSALVLNIGTLNQRTVASMLAAGKRANELNIPVVFDPVGAGTSDLRNKTTHELLKQVRMSVVRGNMSELRFIGGLTSSTRGVDASDHDIRDGSQNGIEMAQNVARQLNCVAAITGAIDYISDGTRTVSIANGHPMLSAVTGTGCMSTSLVGAFCGVTTDYFEAAVAGIMAMGIAGEIAYQAAGSKGTGSFRTALIDSVSRLERETFVEMGKVSEN